MLDCRDLDFSPKLAAERIAAAEAAVGAAVLRRVVAFALFVLGVNRARISKLLEMPPGTVRSLTRRVLGAGVSGFHDHRHKVAAVAQSVRDPEPPPALTVTVPESAPLLVSGGQLDIPAKNTVQRKVVLLSLIGDGMLSVDEVAEALGLSASHVRRLHRDLMVSDVEAVLDKRRGQQADYRVDPELKGQMIVEFVLELAESGRASSAAVARRLGLSIDERVSERTVRYHLNRMGLSQVRESLIAGLRDLKRGSAD